MARLLYFNISVMYSAVAAGLAVNASPGVFRSACVFLAVHGGLWAVYRSVGLIHSESRNQ